MEKKEEFFLNSLLKYFILKRSIFKDIYFLLELFSFRFIDIIVIEEFVYYLSSYGFWSLSSDNVMILICI